MDFGIAVDADNEYVMIDATIVRAHQHAAGALKKNGQDTKDVRKQEAIGRSKGGLTTKIHALVDALGNPLDFILTPGQACDLEGSDAFLPNITAEAVLADKAFDADERVIKPLERAGIKAVIPSKSNRKTPRAHDEDMYKSRHLIENFFAKLKQFRDMFNDAKTARNFLAAVFLVGAYVGLN